MKVDKTGSIVRDNGDTGDSMAETSRAVVFRPWRLDLLLGQFRTEKGFKRHPMSKWPEADMSNDQLVPWLMATMTFSWWGTLPKFGLYIPGTKTLLQPAAIAIVWKQWWLLDLLNRAQGLLLALPWRWSDDDHEGRGIRSSSGKVQDYLNMIVIWHFLQRRGYHFAKLPRPPRECYWAVWRYYARGGDPEPNSKWIREMYFNVLVEEWKRVKK